MKKSDNANNVTAAMYDTLLRPVITEKSMMSSENGKVVFMVPLSATKEDVKAAVEAIFNVKVNKVNTVKQAGKVKRFRGFQGVRSDYKKAVITLAEGQNIDVTAGILPMALKTYKPATPGLRQLIIVDRSELYKGNPEKSLTVGLTKSGGRDNFGHVTSRRIGGGHKRKYRVIDFKRNKFDCEATVERIEYDPNRTSFIALINYEDGEKAYILAPQRLKAGDKVISSEKADIKPGNAMPLKSMPVGTIVHNVELKVGKGGQLVRSAGCYAQVVGKDAGYAQLKLSSGELRIVREECLATVGAVSNPDNQNVSLGKAGRARWLGARPVSRGVAMNPVDRPHGGGEGRTSGGRHPVTPWGKPTKGAKTRSNKKTDRFIMRSRHENKKK